MRRPAVLRRRARRGQQAGPRPASRPVPQVAAEPGLVVEDVETGFCGAVVRSEKDRRLAVTLEDRHGSTACSRWAGAFLSTASR